MHKMEKLFDNFVYFTVFISLNMDLRTVSWTFSFNYAETFLVRNRGLKFRDRLSPSLLERVKIPILIGIESLQKLITRRRTLIIRYQNDENR